ncbi:hypothetical protein [Hoylesella shahii]|uniref:hypothetical protein n=1 Tax=Hoylesella shahii TaxID=228603 RepID=UPI0028E3828F|nr:hypothetical protein [Hoylesella shahii]
MEDALVHTNPWSEKNNAAVLILVLMEDALVRRQVYKKFGSQDIVLILVLMEDALVQQNYGNA